ncbi:MAG TPA: alpha/beta hydrolase-fold protein [Anaerolineales bacterium]|nr:alpha/beta hydrolase-fold protein [Anaerolineales bacterium]
MKKLFPLLVFLMLSACLPGTPQPSEPVGACKTPGSFEILSLEEPARGYPYSYGLYLPPCYATQTDHFYPILIQIPGRGGSPDDFMEAGGVDRVNQMILTGELPPFILVTTENTDNDYEKYGETIWHDLFPALQTAYRVRPERQFHAVSGVSLGGIAAYRLVFQHPEQFASAALFGSGAIVGEETQIRTWLAAIEPEQLPRVFFASGEDDPYMLARAKVLAGMVEEVGIEYVLISGPGGHTYDYWTQNMPVFLRWVAEDWHP